jgi:hypothetical protein
MDKYLKNPTDSNRAGQFYSRAKWPKASVVRWIGGNRPVQRRRRERKGAKAQGRKGKAEKAEEKKGTQRCKGARTQREGGKSEEGKGGECRREGRVKGRDSKATDGLFLKITSGSELHPLNLPCRSFLLCVLAPLHLCVLFFSFSLLPTRPCYCSRPLTISLPARVVIAW